MFFNGIQNSPLNFSCTDDVPDNVLVEGNEGNRQYECDLHLWEINKIILKESLESYLFGSSGLTENWSDLTKSGLTQVICFC